ncbi:DUF3489 domain-containing protein [Methylobacterium oxalidis]|uniref:DUF3489 domain-containing protein n=1 Tax=Methylobacterium oxalidis TaxID=944322 RepID=A0A512JA07_9HYPH|nr:DUF3489 domain-containing protein [Methylobacterium oxalidis]GEP06783.1 hypothetical protein MOX02_48210 [Methylobacterium oxalidis]GJE34467.1 hypothetical protein LDDCCGHA_4678 [Methylobacterium oxalidis]GLS67087.1 hypothetical protein GCM10007888_54700 [Methylobacterium oxalidis]
MPLSEMHLSLLRAAAERQDLLLTRPDGLSPRAARTLAAKLTRADLATQVTVTADQPSWGEIASGPVGLRITSAGLAELGSEAAAPAISLESDDQVADRASEPRSGSKLALMLSLVQREQGATLQDLIGATGWLPHTTRAALTGLRKRGYGLTRTLSAEGQSTYRLSTEATAAAIHNSAA